MASFAFAVTSSPAHPDCARGLLEILRSDPVFDAIGDFEIVHAHSFTAGQWPGPYAGARDVRVADQPGQRGQADRLNAAVAAAEQLDIDSLVVIDGQLWPLRPAFLSATLGRLHRRGALLAAASMRSAEPGQPPADGLWDGLIALDMSWQRARSLFPLRYDFYARGVAAAADRWEVPTVARCLSAAYFQTVTRDVDEQRWLRAALDGLGRLVEFEPVLGRAGAIQPVWHGAGATRDPDRAQRAELVRRIGADGWGPTLRRLADDNGTGWFDDAHGHPRARRRP